MILYPYMTIAQRQTVQLFINLQQPTKLARTVSINYINGTNEHRRRKTLPHRYKIQAVVHAIDKVDIGSARQAEHNCGSLSSATRSMTCSVIGPVIRLGFRNHRSHHPLSYSANQKLSQELTSYRGCVAIEKFLI